MPRQESKANKVSLYRLVPPQEGALTKCLQPKYLDNGFTSETVRFLVLPGCCIWRDSQ